MPNILGFEKRDVENAYKALRANVIAIMEARESIIADFNKPLQGSFVEQKIGNFERRANHLLTMQSQLNAFLQNSIIVAADHLMEDNRQATTFYDYQANAQNF